MKVNGLKIEFDFITCFLFRSIIIVYSLPITKLLNDRRQFCSFLVRKNFSFIVELYFFFEVDWCYTIYTHFSLTSPLNLSFDWILVPRYVFWAHSLNFPLSMAIHTNNYIFFFAFCYIYIIERVLRHFTND